MNNSDFIMRAIWEVSDELIAESENDTLETKPAKSRWLRPVSMQFAGVAAAFVLLVIGTVTMFTVFAPIDTLPQATDTSSYETVSRTTLHVTTTLISPTTAPAPTTTTTAAMQTFTSDTSQTITVTNTTAAMQTTSQTSQTPMPTTTSATMRTTATGGSPTAPTTTANGFARTPPPTTSRAVTTTTPAATLQTPPPTTSPTVATTPPLTTMPSATPNLPTTFVPFTVTERVSPNGCTCGSINRCNIKSWENLSHIWLDKLPSGAEMAFLCSQTISFTAANTRSIQIARPWIVTNSTRYTVAVDDFRDSTEVEVYVYGYSEILGPVHIFKAVLTPENPRAVFTGQSSAAAMSRMFGVTTNGTRNVTVLITDE